MNTIDAAMLQKMYSGRSKENRIKEGVDQRTECFSGT